ncbi:MAG: cyclopropane-fatty-acyl-phospholipid synthase family protein [Proteobacteria bacterium]|nr:cyclopropane-fatty-acyl-phospholipid synthase family protein [Pseudomonadota bacterium]
MKKQLITNERAHALPPYSIGRKLISLHLCRNILFKRFLRMHYGVIEIHDGDNTYLLGKNKKNVLRAVITVNDPFFYTSVVLAGSIGAGESYMRGEWTCDNLTDLVRIIIHNRDALISLDSGLARFTEPLYKLFHAGRKNTRAGSQKNISAHYDLGNDFYSLFLDETLAYSCAIFVTEQSTLKEASLEKFDRICRKLRLDGDDHLLEIGTGWGGFAIHAASNYGCKVTTTTISRKQHDLAGQKIQEAGLYDRITLLFDDYRELQGKFDKIVSIEMIEAVGHHYYEEFFRCCGSLLQPEGLMLLQAITITDQAYEQARNSIDFIKRYIFPGSCIPSLSAIIAASSAASDMKMFHLEDIAPHYAQTLRTWRHNFFENIDAVRGQGFTDSFIRMWEFYLCYCEAGFAERYLGDIQLILTKPNCRHAPIMGSLFS